MPESSSIFNVMFVSSSSGRRPAATNFGTARRANNDPHWNCREQIQKKKWERVEPAPVRKIGKFSEF
jgi:hypothetical protein